MNPQSLLRLSILFLVSTALSGCGEKIGSGSRTIASGDASKLMVFGIRKGKEIGFVIFTDVSSGNAATSSTWAGTVQASNEPVIEYEGDATGLSINGNRYEFTAGRVFLAEAATGDFTVKQLNLPVGDAHYEEAIDSLLAEEAIENFLSP